MAIDPSRIFTESSGKTAAILGIFSVICVLVVFAIRMLGMQKNLSAPPLMNKKDEAPTKAKNDAKTDPPETS